jgi:hypothetical protein
MVTAVAIATTQGSVADCGNHTILPVIALVRQREALVVPKDRQKERAGHP